MEGTYITSGDELPMTPPGYTSPYKPTLRFKGYDLIKELGRGKFGIVWKAIRESDGELIALKGVDIVNDKSKELLDREIKTLQRISKPTCHPYLVCYLGSHFDYNSNMMLIEMKLVEGKNIIDSTVNLSDEERYRYLLLVVKDIIEGIDYLHSNGIIHNDVKPDNIIVTPRPELRPVLVDFGVACFSSLDLCTNDGFPVPCCTEKEGPYQYISPETVKYGVRYPQSDIWSLGIALYVTAINSYPFNVKFKSSNGIFRAIASQQPEKLMTTNHLLNLIVNGCLDKNPFTRITVKEIRELLENL